MQRQEGGCAEAAAGGVFLNIEVLFIYILVLYPSYPGSLSYFGRRASPRARRWVPGRRIACQCCLCVSLVLLRRFIDASDGSISCGVKRGVSQCQAAARAPLDFSDGIDARITALG